MSAPASTRCDCYEERTPCTSSLDPPLPFVNSSNDIRMTLRDCVYSVWLRSQWVEIFEIKLEQTSQILNGKFSFVLPSVHRIIIITTTISTERDPDPAQAPGPLTTKKRNDDSERKVQKRRKLSFRLAAKNTELSLAMLLGKWSIGVWFTGFVFWRNWLVEHLVTYNDRDNKNREWEQNKLVLEN